MEGKINDRVQMKFGSFNKMLSILVFNTIIVMSIFITPTKSICIYMYINKI